LFRTIFFQFQSDIIMCRTKCLFAVLFSVILSMQSFAQKWDLKVDKENVKVYTRSVTGSSVQEFKGEVTIKCNMSGILALIDSISEYTKWMYKITTSYRFKRINQTSGYTYTVISSPWPVSDRDLVSYYKVTQDTTTKVITVSLKGVKDYIPEKPGLVRIPTMTGFWQLTPIAKGVTKVVYQVHCESGGSVPAAIVNAYITDTPYNVLFNMRLLVEAPNYPKKVMKNVKEL